MSSSPHTAPSLTHRIQTLLGRHGVFWLVGIGSALAVLLLIWLLFQPSGTSAQSALLPGHAAPDFTLRDPAGHAYTLRQLRGHPVILNFWSTTCPPCQSETPILQRTYQTYQGQGLVIVGIDQGEPADFVTKFGGDYGLSYPLLVDTSLKMKDLYGVTSLPVSYFIDSQGIIRQADNGILLTDSLAQGLHAIGLTTPNT